MKKKQDPTIRLSERKCVACTKSGFILASEERGLAIPVCADHLVANLTDWEAEVRAADKAAELAKQQQRSETRKEPNGVGAASK